MAASALKIESNRANAQLSTGPKTDAGRATSSHNSEKHNLTGGSAFVEGENREEYEIHCQKQFRQYKPVAEHEIFLVTEMADSMWRLKRAHRMENELMEASANPYLEDEEKLAVQLQRLTRYKAALERTYYRAYNEIKRINAERNRTSGPAYQIHRSYANEPLNAGVRVLEQLADLRLPQQSEHPERKLPASMQFMLNEFSRTQGRTPSRE